MRLVAPAVVVLLMCCAASARAQQSVTIEFDGGQVTLRVQNAPVRAILAEWARLGGSTIVNGDRVAGPPVTLELTGVPERQALDVVLRNVAGYMLAPRRAGATGASAFDRILILPTSVAPRNPSPPAPAAFAPGRQTPLQPPIFRQPPTPVEVPADGNGDPDADDHPTVTPPTVTPPPVTPRPGMRVVTPPRPFQPQLPVGAEPLDPEEYQEQSEAPADAAAPTPANPFGVPFGSSPTPGAVTPVPQLRPPAAGRRPPSP